MKKIIYLLVFAFATTISISAYTIKKITPATKQSNLGLGLASDPR
jgi:hypothetical protein